MNDKPVIIDGQQVRDWRKELEMSNIYVALITKDFCDDMICIEQTIFAKQHQIPTIVLWHEGVELSIPDLLEGMNIKARFTFNEENKYEVKKCMEKAVKKILSESRSK